MEIIPRTNIDTGWTQIGQWVSSGRRNVKHTENARIPPLRNLRVHCHQSSVDIRLLVHRLPALSPNLLAEEKERVRQRRSDAGEAQSIGYRESRRQEQRRVIVILLKVDGRVGVKDLSDVVRCTGIVERAAR